MVMVYLILILSIFFTGVLQFVNKKISLLASPVFIAWVIALVSFVFTLPVLFTEEFRASDVPSFSWFLLALVTGAGYMTATILFNTALKKGEISELASFYNFSSIFTILTGFVIFRDAPSITGLIGILIIFLGSEITENGYQLKNFSHYTLALKKPEVRMVLTAVLVNAIIIWIEKIGINATNNLVWSFAVQSFFVVMMTSLVFIKKEFKFSNFVKVYNPIVLFLVMLPILYLARGFVLQDTSPAILASAMSLANLVTILLGAIILRENHGREKFHGGLVMVLGVIIINLGLF